MASISRKRHSPQFKFKVALEAAKQTKTVNDLAGQYALHPTQISHWKRKLMEEGPSVFSSTTERDRRRQEAERAELFEQIGRLKMETEWLKKKL